MKEQTNQTKMPTAETDTGNHGIPASRQGDAGSEHEGSTGRFCKGSKEIRSHASYITYIVSHVVSNSCGVARIVLRDAMDNLSHEISTNISSLGINASANTPKHSNRR